MINEEIKKKIREERNMKFFFKEGYMLVLLRPHFAYHYAWNEDKSLIFHLNGYVGVPKGHKLYKKDYNNKLLDDIRIHGGLTYSGWLMGDKTYWFFGFDTAHYNDLCMDCSYLPSLKGDTATYKDEKYVMGEVKSLLKQITAKKEEKKEVINHNGKK
jgi:hypothetical protein